nr:MAG TPA: hypothetical protein [Caudoviricetes sp.]
MLYKNLACKRSNQKIHYNKQDYNTYFIPLIPKVVMKAIIRLSNTLNYYSLE